MSLCQISPPWSGSCLSCCARTVPMAVIHAYLIYLAMHVDNVLVAFYPPDQAFPETLCFLDFVASNALDFSITFLVFFFSRHPHKQFLFHSLFKCVVFVFFLWGLDFGHLFFSLYLLSLGDFITLMSLASPCPCWQFTNLYFQPRCLAWVRSHTYYLFNLFVDMHPRNWKPMKKWTFYLLSTFYFSSTTVHGMINVYSVE